MSGFVLDTSIVLSWCLKDEKDNYSDDILGRLSESEAVIPAFGSIEIANILIVAERKAKITEADINRLINLLASLPIRIAREPSNLALESIVAIARQHKVSAYDALYLELAMREGLGLATRAKSLREAARKCGVSII